MFPFFEIKSGTNRPLYIFLYIGIYISDGFTRPINFLFLRYGQNHKYKNLLCFYSVIHNLWFIDLGVKLNIFPTIKLFFMYYIFRGQDSRFFIQNPFGLFFLYNLIDYFGRIFDFLMKIKRKIQKIDISCYI